MRRILTGSGEDGRSNPRSTWAQAQRPGGAKHVCSHVWGERGGDETSEIGRGQIMKVGWLSVEIRLCSLGTREPRMAVEQQSDPISRMENGS